MSLLVLALADKSLNRSVVNSDIEADVSALEAFFTNLQTPLIPADLSAIFQRVFLHLEVTVGLKPPLLSLFCFFNSLKHL